MVHHAKDLVDQNNMQDGLRVKAKQFRVKAFGVRV